MNVVKTVRRTINTLRFWFRRDSHRYAFVIFFCLSWLINNAQAFESTVAYSHIPKYRQLDREYNQFSAAFYRSIASQSQDQDYRSFDMIISDAKHDVSQGNMAGALVLLISHKKLLGNNLNSRGIIEAEKILLQGHEYDTARHYLQKIKDSADPSIISNVQYAFAKYYFSQNRWRKTIDIIENIINDLPSVAYQHALLMQGISLQNLRKQRKALAQYKKISKKSKDYVAARINMAVADTRQGWWTDGYDILKNLLKRKDVKSDKTLSDRIHTLIGYIFLQQEYYRNSRNAFRNVELKGPYTNKALLGIALDAGYQKDYVGALNAARILKNKKTSALQVDEANLLLPYFYEKLGQTATASAGYTDAISYYQSKIRRLNHTLNAVDNLTKFPVSATNTAMSIQDENVDLGEYFPPAFFSQYSLLNAYSTRVNELHNTQLKQQHKMLLHKYKNQMKAVLAQALKMKKHYLTDYMNQSRYGLARLYDKNTSSAQ